MPSTALFWVAGAGNKGWGRRARRGRGGEGTVPGVPRLTGEQTATINSTDEDRQLGVFLLGVKALTIYKASSRKNVFVPCPSSSLICSSCSVFDNVWKFLLFVANNSHQVLKYWGKPDLFGFLGTIVFFSLLPVYIVTTSILTLIPIVYIVANA